MKLGEKIKLLRSEKGLTQPELAEKSGIEQSYLSKLENEKGTPSFEIIGRIAEALEIKTMELINSLNPSYVECNLSHIPEISAEYAAIRYRREANAKNRFFIATFLVSIGFGLYLFAYYSAQMGVVAYTYYSPGIINNEMSFERGGQARGVTDVTEGSDFLLSYEYLGEEFISPVENGDRYYYKSGEETLDNAVTSQFVTLIIGVVGVISIVVGICTFLFGVRFSTKWKRSNT